jgi:hypothetical protein
MKTTCQKLIEFRDAIHEATDNTIGKELDQHSKIKQCLLELDKAVRESLVSISTESDS